MPPFHAFQIRLLCTLGALLASLAFPLLALQNPLKNWDIVGYTAAILAPSHADAASLHTATWNELAKGIGDTQSIREGSEYMHAVATDPEALRQQLPYYQPRIAYTSLAKLLSQATGLDIPRATLLVSSLSASAVFLGVYFILARRFSAPVALALALALAACLHWFVLARASSPDMLATLLGFSAVLCLHQGKTALFALLSALLLLTRHDQIILVSLLALFYPQAEDMRKRIATLAFLALVFAGVYLSSQWYGWGILFMHTFSTPYAYPAGVTPHLHDILPLYWGQWRAIYQGIASDFQSHLPIAAAAIALAIRSRTDSKNRRLLDILLLSMLAKLLAFPAIAGHWGRIYMAEIISIIVISAMTIEHRQNFNPKYSPKT